MSDWETVFQEVVRPAVARAKDLKALEIGRGVLAEAGQILRRNFDGDSIVVFADEAGFAAAGDRFVASARQAGFTVHTHILPAHPRPKASEELARSFEPLLAGKAIIPVSLGSGVMNDLVKYAAFRQQQPYCSVATAASMDGYASAGAPLSKEGFKITIPVRCPRVIIADLDVIAAAPAEMAGWGYGDLAGKVPAGADWILADALEIEAIDPGVWSLVQDHLRDSLSDPVSVRQGAFAAVAKLFLGLTMSGLAMEFCGSSRPASGAEHQIAHMWEMQGLTFAGERVSHGACVAVGTLTMLELYEWLLRQDLSSLDVESIVAGASDLQGKFGEIDRWIANPRIAERARTETEAKHPSQIVAKARLNRLVRLWPDLRQKLSSQLVPAAEIAALLANAGAPVRAADIGVTEAELRSTVYASRFLRSRYTLVDLLDETGLLDAAVNEVFEARIGDVAGPVNGSFGSNKPHR